MRAAVVCILVLAASPAHAGNARTIAKKAGYTGITVYWFDEDSHDRYVLIGGEKKDGVQHLALVDRTRKKVIDLGPEAALGDMMTGMVAVEVMPFLGRKDILDVVISGLWANEANSGEHHFVVRGGKVACDYDGRLTTDTIDRALRVDKISAKPLTWDVVLSSTASTDTRRYTLGASGRCKAK
jgi:hypothetical protein